jgi:4-hydroxybenzoate polyprenyltransferase
MNNLPFLIFLYGYGALMSKWFFRKKKIQKSLPLALITHNPVQAIMNVYIISFTIIKYDLKVFTLQNIMAVMTLYFPALIWEVSRKIRAPKDETEYTTYSKLFGYKKATKFVLIVTIMDIITNFILVWNLSKISVIALFVNVCWMTWKFIEFMGDPTQYKIVDKVERYTYIQESIMLLTVAGYIAAERFGFWLP